MKTKPTNYAYIFSGLPGVGKSTIAKMLSSSTKSTYIRIDTLEHCLKKQFSTPIIKQGYELAFKLARDNLEVGNNVVIDCCNTTAESRLLLNSLKLAHKTKTINIEITCEDLNEHKHRVNTRCTTNTNRYPSWDEVTKREYEIWDDYEKVLKIDNSDSTIDQSLRELMKGISKMTSTSS